MIDLTLNFIFGATEKINFCDVIKNPEASLLMMFISGGSLSVELIWDVYITWLLSV